MSSDTRLTYEDVTTNDGKYTVRLCDNGRHRALRYGQDWPAYEGVTLSNLEIELAQNLLETRKQLEIMRDAERKTSAAYVKLRTMIPGALDTPTAPTTEQIQTITEAALQKLLDRQTVSEPLWMNKLDEELEVSPRDGEKKAIKLNEAEASQWFRERFINLMQELLGTLKLSERVEHLALMEALVKMRQK